MINKIILSGRVCADPQIRTSENGIKTANYTLAVQRRHNREEADFFRCVVFRNGADFVERFIRKGMRINIEGSVQTGSFTNKEGVRIPTFDIVVAEHDFCEPRRGENGSPEPLPAPEDTRSGEPQTTNDSSTQTEDGFIQIPDDIDDQLPFK